MPYGWPLRQRNTSPVRLSRAAWNADTTLPSGMTAASARCRGRQVALTNLIERDQVRDQCADNGSCLCRRPAGVARSNAAVAQVQLQDPHRGDRDAVGRGRSTRRDVRSSRHRSLGSPPWCTRPELPPDSRRPPPTARDCAGSSWSGLAACTVRAWRTEQRRQAVAHHPEKHRPTTRVPSSVDVLGRFAGRAVAAVRWHDEIVVRALGQPKTMVNGRLWSQRPRCPSARRILCGAVTVLAAVSGCTAAQPANPGRVSTISSVASPGALAASSGEAGTGALSSSASNPASSDTVPASTSTHRNAAPTASSTTSAKRPSPDQGTRHRRGESFGGRGSGADAFSGGIGR